MNDKTIEIILLKVGEILLAVTIAIMKMGINLKTIWYNEDGTLFK